MLSRVAERLYWMARYLERAGNTARMNMAVNSLGQERPRGRELAGRGGVGGMGGGGLGLA